MDQRRQLSLLLLPENDPVYDLPVGIASFAVIVNGTLGTMQFVVSDNLGTSYRSEAFVISPT